MTPSYLVSSLSSLGYVLYDEERKDFSTHPKRGTVSFRKESILVGDEVVLDDRGEIDAVLPRRSLLKRPRLSNADLVLVLVSAKEPEFSSYLLDKFLSLVTFSSLPAAIGLTKSDLLSPKERMVLKERMAEYEKIGFPVFFLSSVRKKDDLPILLPLLRGKKTALMGQTGVGKSTLLNRIDPDFLRKVDERGNLYGRGRHTTKEVILLPYLDGFLYDTPGFSELVLEEMKPVDLANSFPGYRKYFPACKFNDCLHGESTKGCAVLEAVKSGLLSLDSYRNYLKIMEEVKENDVWKKKLKSGRPF